MSNKRYFMMGIGTGIIIGALMLQLIYIAQTSITTGDEQKLYTEEEVAELLAARQPSSTSGTVQNGVDSKGEPSSDPQGADENASEPTPTNIPSPTIVPSPSPSSEPTQHILRIYPGTNLTEAAALLVDNHIIDEDQSQTFMSLMKKGEKVVRAGWFKFHEQMTPEEAIKVVTGVPLPKNE